MEDAILGELEETNSSLHEELILLTEIFVKELKISEKNNDTLELVISLTPSTGDRWDLKYVFLDLNILLSISRYPDVVPLFRLSKVRGVSDDHQIRIVKELQQLSNERVGEGVLYDLIELVKETLTSNNMPAGNCPICLESFSGYCHFTITECTHYFHMACLSEHLKHLDRTLDKQARCPSCREILDEDYVEALERNTDELGLKCNLHKPDKQEFLLDQNIINQQLKYQEHYLKQKSNNAFFTGEQSHVLDLTSRNVVSNTLENVANDLENDVSNTLENVANDLENDVSEISGNLGIQTPEVSSSSEKTETPKAKNATSTSDECLIISFSSLMNTTPESSKQDQLGSTASTAPSSYLEDSQSEISVSLSHESSVTPETQLRYTQHLGEKDDLCYTDDEVVEEEDSGDDETREETEEIFEGHNEHLPLSGLEEEEEEECVSGATVTTEDVTNNVTDDVTNSVTEDVTNNVTEDVTNSVTEDVPQDVTDYITEDVTEDILGDITEDITVGITEDISGEITEDISVGITEDISGDITEDISGDLTEDRDILSQDGEPPYKTVSLDESNIAQSQKEKGESKEMQTQTRRVKRNRNKRRGGSEGGGRHHDYESNNRGGNRPNHQKRNNNQLEGIDPVVYRRGGRNRGNHGNHGNHGNRAVNCRSYHEGDSNQHFQHNHRRHSFTEQNWRSEPRDRAGSDHYNNRARGGSRGGSRSDHSTPPQQPRFKPPRILRQEALEQAKKLEQQETSVMHKIPVSMYNPGAVSQANFHLNHPTSYQLSQIPPHIYQQALNQYHMQQSSSVRNAAIRSNSSSIPHSSVRNAAIRSNSSSIPRSEVPHSQPSKPTPKFIPGNSEPSLQKPSPQSYNKSATGSSGDNIRSRDQPLISPTKQIFDVSRFQQSILRNNKSPSSSK